MPHRSNYKLLLCIKDELQQPMGTLGDAISQCKQLDEKISKMSIEEFEALHGDCSSDAKTIIE